MGQENCRYHIGQKVISVDYGPGVITGRKYEPFISECLYDVKFDDGRQFEVLESTLS